MSRTCEDTTNTPTLSLSLSFSGEASVSTHQRSAAQMLLHCLEHQSPDQPNWELLLISYCLCVSDQAFDECSSQPKIRHQTESTENEPSIHLNDTVQKIIPGCVQHVQMTITDFTRIHWSLAPPFPVNANRSGGGSSPRSRSSSRSFFCTQQTHCIILSFVFTMKSMGSKLRKIKGHCVCHLETLLPSLLTHPEKGHAIIYLIPPPSRRLSSPSCTHPASQPAGL